MVKELIKERSEIFYTFVVTISFSYRGKFL